MYDDDDDHFNFQFLCSLSACLLAMKEMWEDNNRKKKKKWKSSNSVFWNIDTLIVCYNSIILVTEEKSDILKPKVCKVNAFFISVWCDHFNLQIFFLFSSSACLVAKKKCRGRK